MLSDKTHIALYLADFGQSVTLSWRSSRRQVQGVVSHDVDPVRFLAQGRSIPVCVLNMERLQAAVLTPDWTVTIDGEARPVLEVVDDKFGLVNVYLGDVITC